jgi:hypothetical protein
MNCLNNTCTKTTDYVVLLKTVTTLKHRPSIHYFEHLTLDKITRLGGYCLAQGWDGTDEFQGIALFQEFAGWCIHLRPGRFGISEQGFDRMMPIALERLKELKIAPDFYVENVLGRFRDFTKESFLNSTKEEFQRWQAKQTS